ncbi:MAG: glycosyltransferase [Eubacteriales bacterium]|nr:glycosyltransferase [Eubacteriales bacterium]
MIIALYVLFAISLIAPIYTYAIYPLILKLLPVKKKYSADKVFTPFVTVILRQDSDKSITDSKLKNLSEQNYPCDKIEIITVSVTDQNGASAFNEALATAKGEIIVISDAKTRYDGNAVRNLVKHFSDKQIGCVVGQLRKIGTAGDKIDNGAFWKYENFVRRQESKLGAVSGANHTIYAFRNGVINSIPQNIIDADFYISTYILQAGRDVIMDSDAVAYETPEDDKKQQFDRHVHDGMGYYQALGVFSRLLLPRKGSFVYVSHRVMKWFVPVNMLLLLVSNFILAVNSVLFLISLIMQIFLYLIVIAYNLWVVKKNRKAQSIVFKLLSLALYFVSINLSLLMGLFRYVSGKQKDTLEAQR